MYWNKVLQEVLNKNSSSYNFTFTDVYANKRKKNKNLQAGRKKEMNSYSLGDNFKDISFTQREAECMFLLLKGKTILQVSKILGLSSRTVEFYVKNMKIKLHCRTKSELIGKVLESSFIEYKINLEKL
jgi:DNA-binding CsgD family transcriptional regulator